jgi:hypothetical protein
MRPLTRLFLVEVDENNSLSPRPFGYSATSEPICSSVLVLPLCGIVATR